MFDIWIFIMEEIYLIIKLLYLLLLSNKFIRVVFYILVDNFLIGRDN